MVQLEKNFRSHYAPRKYPTLALRLTARTGFINDPGQEPAIPVSRDSANRSSRYNGKIVQPEPIEVTQTQQMHWLGTLASGLMHDFNHMLQLVLTCADLAAEALPDDPGQAAQLLSDIQQVVLEARQYTRQLMTLAQCGPGEPQLVDLTHLLRELHPVLERLVGRDRLKMSLEEGLVLGHTWQLRQLVLNLVLNAAEAYSEGVGEVIVRLRCSAETVSLEVQDFGCGMSPEFLETACRPFITTKAQSGRGLGLAFVAAIVQGHEARLSVDSRSGQGSLFTVEFKAR